MSGSTTIIMAFASMVAAVVPMMIYLLFIWWLDRNEREPFWLVFLNFFWGATGAIILGIIGSLIFQIPLSTVIHEFSSGNSSDLEQLSGAIITAPIVEEFTKGIFLVGMCFSKRVDGAVDGVVYGGAIGLGFGMTENFMYFLTYGSTPADWLVLVIIRTLFSAVMHLVSQGTFGAIVGYAKFISLPFMIISIFLGYIVAVIIHFLWNFFVSFEDTSILGFLFLFLYVSFGFAVLQVALYFESRFIAKELQEESKEGTIPPDHLRFIPYVYKRYRKGWCPYGVHQKEYVRDCITLALRRNQYKRTSGIRRESILKDIQQLRYKIQQMFYNANLRYHNYYKGN